MKYMLLDTQHDQIVAAGSTTARATGHGKVGDKFTTIVDEVAAVPGTKVLPDTLPKVTWLPVLGSSAPSTPPAAPPEQIQQQQEEQARPQQQQQQQ